ncbi:oligopeptidase A [Arsenophonus symbiont of Ornithomya chloropus]|uniref:oligopeptidase A n=1 Tax=Arsenophonus symbiont of Ornithomya chloropus TaxID=634121 RepID=UPI0032B1C549
MNNPLLTKSSLPNFSKISPQHVFPAMTYILQEYRKAIYTILTENSNFNWNNLCQPLENMNDQLARFWSSISHLHAVKDNVELRAVYNSCLPILSEFNTWIGHHTGLYKSYKILKNSTEFDMLDLAQRTSIKNRLRDFKLSGIGLSAKKKKRFREISICISELKNHFSNNVLDATMGWGKLIKDIKVLSGIPESMLLIAKKLAASKGENGWLFTLDMPNYLSVMTYADNHELRQEMYYAYNTRASDEGPNAGKWDNTHVMYEILALRHELAKLLGFDNFFQQSLVTKMAKSPKQVLDFLIDFGNKVYHQGKKEFCELQQFVKKYYGLKKIEPWDISYYSEKVKQNKFDINNEKIRAYFPEQIVLKGLFKIINRVFALTVKERFDIEKWHADVRFFELYDEYSNLCGSFYLDLYIRENKQSGAWMNTCVDRLKNIDGTYQKPIAYLICNFNKPTDDKPALFTHEEVITLFHEFGHVLHHLLTKIDVVDVAGINGVPWDAIELPSQMMEYWCWEPEALELISGHYETGQPLSKFIIEKMLATKNYQAAMCILRQLELGLFDLYLHLDYLSPKSGKILSILKSIKEQFSVISLPEWSRIPHTFSHIFSGDYAAGYYSYLWADVLAADAFSRFSNEGIFNRNTGLSFVENILSRGGSESPIVLFKRFRGRLPKKDAILKSYGFK